MTTPTPPPDTYGPPVHVDHRARLLVEADAGPCSPTSWTVTFGFGKPAERTYSEVRFPPEVLDRLGADPDLDGFGLDPHTIERLLDDLVRQIAGELYGTAWAFHYRPDEFATAIEAYNVRRREVVVVESVEVYS